MSEPELNVEAEITTICREAWAAINEEMKVQKVEYSMGTAYSCLSELRETVRPRILVLIQQVSDQRVREFAKVIAQTAAAPEMTNTIDAARIMAAVDQTLADYLSHKEARDGK